jgi:hypothetical protein
MTPQDVLVEPLDGEPVLWDLAPEPVAVTWAELAEARAGVRSAKHRLVVAEPQDDFGDDLGSSTSEADLPGAVAAGIADSWAGMLDPPMRKLGRPGLATVAGSYRELAAAWTTLAETARDAAGPEPLDPDTRTTLLAGLRGQVLDLAEAELQAATKLKELA